MTSCVGKKRFDTSEAAKAKLHEIATVGEKRLKTPRRAYQCAMCLGWHLTAMTGATLRHRDTWRQKRLESA